MPRVRIPYAGYPTIATRTSESHGPIAAASSADRLALSRHACRCQTGFDSTPYHRYDRMRLRRDGVVVPCVNHRAGEARTRASVASESGGGGWAPVVAALFAAILAGVPAHSAAPKPLLRGSTRDHWHGDGPVAEIRFSRSNKPRLAV